MGNAIEIEVCIDGHDLARLQDFWCALLDYRPHGATGPYRSLVPAERGQGPKLVLQQVPEPKAGKNRVHLDLYVDRAVFADEVARAESLGASRVGAGEVTEGDETWVVLADPEGNEFCLCTH